MTSSEDVQKTAASSMSNCTPTYQDVGELAETSSKSVTSALDAMKLKSCSYQKSAGAVGGCSVFMGGCGGAAYAEQSSTGCESINVVSNMMNQVTSQLSCTLNQSSASLTATAANIQEISFKAGDVSGGSDLNFSNKNSLKTNFVNLSQGTTQKEIAGVITQGIQDTVSQAQATNNEAFSDPTSQKQSAQLLSDIQSVASSTDISSNVSETALSIQGDQKITIEVGNVTDSSITITNDNCFDLVAQNFAYNAIEEVVNNSTVQQSASALAQTQSQANSGVMSGFSGMIINLLITGVVIGILWYLYKKYMDKPKKKTDKSQKTSQSKPSSSTTTPPPAGPSVAPSPPGGPSASTSFWNSFPSFGFSSSPPPPTGGSSPQPNRWNSYFPSFGFSSSPTNTSSSGNVPSTSTTSSQSNASSPGNTIFTENPMLGH
jgi:large-conductance mechanosensitive channel